MSLILFGCATEYMSNVLVCQICCILLQEEVCV